jgi:hypothetical protein
MSVGTLKKKSALEILDDRSQCTVKDKKNILLDGNE